MYSFRGDAHKLYLQLKKTSKKNQSIKSLKKLMEIAEIQSFYQSVDTSTLRLIYFRMLKEKSGTGIIPIFVTAVPWFFFLFSSRLEQFLFKNGSFLWILFGVFYMLVLAISVVLHFREKAWAAIHIELIQDELEERKK